MVHKDNRSTAIALGMFDGMHIGHCALISRMVDIARNNSLTSMVYTFSNHPMGVFATAPKVLSTVEERLAMMRALGVERVEMVTFDRALADMSPEDFAKMLVERYDVKAVVAGFNYTFGKAGAGKEDELRRLGEELGFSVEVLPPVLFLGSPVSSTRVRKALESGDAAGALDMLGHPYRLDGRVLANRHIGREMGFPTANLEPTGDKLLPKAGVYATVANVEGRRLPAVTNIGDNPTVQGKKVTVETHILSFDGDLYGKPLQVEFLSRIRDEQRFGSRAELAHQIGRDVETARQLFARTELGA